MYTHLTDNHMHSHCGMIFACQLRIKQSFHTRAQARLHHSTSQRGIMMTSRYSIFLGLALLVTPLHSSYAAIVSFILDGNAGLGLLPGNENPATTGGSGGLGPGGIHYNTDTNVLSIDILWGSGNGFEDLTGDVTVSHIHGVTNTPPDGFLDNRGVLYGLDNLPGFDFSGSSGGFLGTVDIGEVHEANLLAGQTYINVHTEAFPGGEIRGQLVVNPIPIPAAFYLFATGLIALVGAARRRKNA